MQESEYVIPRFKENTLKSPKPNVKIETDKIEWTMAVKFIVKTSFQNLGRLMN